MSSHWQSYYIFLYLNIPPSFVSLSKIFYLKFKLTIKTCTVQVQIKVACVKNAHAQAVQFSKLKKGHYSTTVMTHNPNLNSDRLLWFLVMWIGIRWDKLKLEWGNQNRREWRTNRKTDRRTVNGNTVCPCWLQLGHKTISAIVGVFMDFQYWA